MAMAVGMSALMKGDGILRTQNLQRNKMLPLVLKPWRLTDAMLKTVCGMFSVVMQMTHVTYQALLKPQLSGRKDIGWGGGVLSCDCWSWLSWSGSWQPTPTACISKTELCEGVSEEHSALGRGLDNLEFTLLSFHFTQRKHFLSITRDLNGNG